jgi:broad specificity phosphatase PhoE
MTRLLLIRHGETDWNVEGRWQGQIDVPLNARGRQHASQIADELVGEDIQAIYASDLSRALETAQPLASRLGLPVRTDARLREINQGEWQGLLVTEIQARYAELFRLRKDNPRTVAPPGGETVSQVQERVEQALNDILQRHPGETMAIVAHGFVIAVLRVRLENKPIDEVWDLIPESGEWITYDIL